MFVQYLFFKQGLTAKAGAEIVQIRNADKSKAITRFIWDSPFNSLLQIPISSLTSLILYHLLLMKLDQMKGKLQKCDRTHLLKLLIHIFHLKNHEITEYRA